MPLDPDWSSRERVRDHISSLHNPRMESVDSLPWPVCPSAYVGVGTSKDSQPWNSCFLGNGTYLHQLHISFFKGQLDRWPYVVTVSIYTRVYRVYTTKTHVFYWFISISCSVIPISFRLDEIEKIIKGFDLFRIETHSISPDLRGLRANNQALRWVGECGFEANSHGSNSYLCIVLAF